MKLRFSERDPVTIAIAGIGAMVGIIVGSFQLAALPIIAGPSYTAVLAQSGGLESGDLVKVAGTKVGKIKSVDVKDGAVQVEFTAKGVSLGEGTTADIKTLTLLGERYLSLTPRGEVRLPAGSVIPLERTHSPKSIAQTVDDLSRRTSELDLDETSKALDTFADAFASTSRDLGPAFEGVTRLSRTVAERDEAVRDLFRHANQVTGVLNEHSEQLTTLVRDGNTLMTELYARRQAIHDLLNSTVDVTNELVGFSKEQKDRLRPALEELNHTIGILRRNDDNIVVALQRVSAFITSLGEGVSYGPWFSGDADLSGLAFFPTAQFIPGLSVPLPKQPPIKEPLPPIGGLIGQGGGN